MQVGSEAAPQRSRPQAAWEASVAQVAQAYAWLDAVSPLRVLAVLLVGQWLAVLALARTVHHNGWIYYQGGDQLWHSTGAWLLIHGKMPYPEVSPGWSTLLAPITAITGPDLLQAFPPIVVLNLLIGLPVALLCTYGIGARLGGRVFGYWAALLWILVPYLGIRYTLPGYHERYTEAVLPQSLGLTAMADFPSMVALLVSAYFCVRAIERESVYAGVAAGIAAGLGILVKTSSMIYLAGPLLALLWARRWRSGLAMAVATVPGLLTLTLWKERGYGHLPTLSGAGASRQLALGAGPTAFTNPVGRYVNLDWNHLHDTLLLIREHFWSDRMIEWLVLAGLIGLLRRSRPIGLLMLGWFGAFVIVKGTSTLASIEDTTAFRLLMPAYPAFLLMIAAVPLLFPRIGTVLREPRPPFELSRRVRVGLLAAVTVVVAAWPLALVAAATPVQGSSGDAWRYKATLVPEVASLRPRVSVHGRTVRLTWSRPHPDSGKVFFHVLRSRGPQGGAACNPNGSAAANCWLTMWDAGTTKGTSLVRRLPPGRWTFRLGVAANWLDDETQGDIYAVSPPVRATLR